MKRLLFSALPLLLAAGLAGCTGINTQTISKDTSDKVAERKVAMAQAFKENYSGEPRVSPYVVSKNEIFIASRSSTTRGDSRLPAMFDSMVLRFPGRYTLAAVAERVTKETRIPVSIDADVARASEGAQPLNIAIQKDANSYAELDQINPFVNSKDAIDIYRNTPNTLYSEEFELD